MSKKNDILSLVQKEDPDPEMIKSIETLLDDAKNGKIVLLAFVAQRSGARENTLAIHDGGMRAQTRDRFSLLGGIHYLAHMLMADIDEND